MKKVQLSLTREIIGDERTRVHKLRAQETKQKQETGLRTCAVRVCK